MNDQVHAAVRTGAAGFALALALALLLRARAEVALGRALLAALLVGGVTLTASALNRGGDRADEEKKRPPAASD
ncbi:MAG: hypothetical protein HY812_10760 [Planctomycetes bacterium]|nr:hypothetical protein [Planctomycetota bacterium]